MVILLNFASKVTRQKQPSQITLDQNYSILILNIQLLNCLATVLATLYWFLTVQSVFMDFKDYLFAQGM